MVDSKQVHTANVSHAEERTRNKERDAQFFSNEIMIIFWQNVHRTLQTPHTTVITAKHTHTVLNQNVQTTISTCTFATFRHENILTLILPLFL